MLTISSCQSPIADAACAAVAGWLAAALDMPVRFVGDVGWEERARRFDAGEIDLCWMCGTWYLKRRDVQGVAVQPVAAPVMAGERYGGQPVYFSDVVVRQDAPYATFADLRGATWAYNEPDSHSGFHVVRHHLATLGEGPGYFGRWVEAGSHEAALALIAAGKVDAAAIDSTVLEAVVGETPDLAAAVRVVATLGPSPMPPWVVRSGIAPEIRQRLVDLLASMHLDTEGKTALQRGGWQRFAAVIDGDYDGLRVMVEMG